MAVFDIVTRDLLNKPLSAARGVNLSELLGLPAEVINAVAKKSNGQFIIDREKMIGFEFIAKYFPDAKIRTYDEIIQSRQSVMPKKKGSRKPLGTISKFGEYVVAYLTEGSQFAVTFRRLESAKTAFKIAAHAMTYKIDGRVYSIVSRHDSRSSAMIAKSELKEELIASGKYEMDGVLPV